MGGRIIKVGGESVKKEKGSGRGDNDGRRRKRWDDGEGNEILKEVKESKKERGDKEEIVRK